MNQERSPLRMIRLGVEPRLLAEGMRTRADRADSGYHVHAFLAHRLGADAVRPFRILESSSPEERDSIRVVGYTRLSRLEIETRWASRGERAGRGLPEISSPLPETWTVGARYAFEVLACPTVRLASRRATVLPGGAAESFDKGAEVDAWYHRRWLASPPHPTIDRETAYGEWLDRQMTPAAGLEGVVQVARSSERLYRQTQADDHGNRRGRAIQRPAVLFQGGLTVADPEGFGALVERGIGRHRAFGFGMLLLKPNTPN